VGQGRLYENNVIFFFVFRVAFLRVSFVRSFDLNEMFCQHSKFGNETIDEKVGLGSLSYCEMKPTINSTRQRILRRVQSKPTINRTRQRIQRAPLIACDRWTEYTHTKPLVHAPREKDLATGIQPRDKTVVNIVWTTVISDSLVFEGCLFE